MENVDVKVSELVQAKLNQLSAELDSANTKLSASYTVWLMSPEIRELKDLQTKAKQALQDLVVNTMKDLQLDTKQFKYNLKLRKFVIAEKIN